VGVQCALLFNCYLCAAVLLHVLYQDVVLLEALWPTQGACRACSAATAASDAGSQLLSIERIEGIRIVLVSLQPHLRSWWCCTALCRYSQHTANCVQCQTALKRIRSAQHALSILAGVAASLAILAAAVAAGSSATAATAAAMQAGGVLGRIAQLGLGLLQFVAGAGVQGAAGGGFSGQAAAAGSPAAFGRFVVFSSVAVLSWLVRQQLLQLEGKLLHGDYPPPRNMDRT
jgi:hypothetical protein